MMVLVLQQSPFSKNYKKQPTLLQQLVDPRCRSHHDVSAGPQASARSLRVPPEPAEVLLGQTSCQQHGLAVHVLSKPCLTL